MKTKLEQGLGLGQQGLEQQGFEEWWNQQPISNAVAPHMELIQQSYKDLCLQAWIASRSDLKSRMDYEGLTKG